MPQGSSITGGASTPAALSRRASPPLRPEASTTRSAAREATGGTQTHDPWGGRRFVEHEPFGAGPELQVAFSLDGAAQHPFEGGPTAEQEHEVIISRLTRHVAHRRRAVGEQVVLDGSGLEQVPPQVRGASTYVGPDAADEAVRLPTLRHPAPGPGARGEIGRRRRRLTVALDDRHLVARAGQR